VQNPLAGSRASKSATALAGNGGYRIFPIPVNGVDLAMRGLYSGVWQIETIAIE